MNAILFLCGSNESGKTTTLEKLFTSEEKYRVRQTNFFQKTINNKKICVFGTDSPHEKEEIKQCKKDQKPEEDITELVIADIDKRLEVCQENANGQNYILIVPMSINQKGRGKGKPLYEDCVIKPIEHFKKTYKVFSFCLEKMNTQEKKMKDKSLKEIGDITEDTTSEQTNNEKDCNKSKELLMFITRKVIPKI